MTPSEDWPPEAGPHAPADLVPLGRIIGGYGVHGWIRVHPYGSAGDSALPDIDNAWVRPTGSGGPGGPGGSGRSADGAAGSANDTRWRPIRLLDARPQGESIVVRAQGCGDRNDALAIKGWEIAAARADFPATDSDEYYWVDLIGCEVVGQAGVALGRVEAVDDFGAPHPVLRVVEESDGERRVRLIPFVDPVVATVDLERRRIDADWSPDY